MLRSRGQARDAAAEARIVLAQPRLPADLRDRAMAAHLQALAGLRDDLAVSLAGTVLAARNQYDGHVVAAALVARAIIGRDRGRDRGRIFRKLTVGSRVELTRIVLERGTAAPLPGRLSRLDGEP